MEYESSYAQAGLNHLSSLTFGRDVAQLKQLIALITVISIVLWVLVLMSIVLRMGARYIVYRGHSPVVIGEDVPME